MQLQIFFADPDYPKEALPGPERIKKLKDHVEKYELDIVCHNGSETKTVTHCHSKPFPPFVEEEDDNGSSREEEDSEQLTESENEQQKGTEQPTKDTLKNQNHKQQ